MGIAELDVASCDRAFAGWFPGRAHPRLGLRRDAARNSGHPESFLEGIAAAMLLFSSAPAR